MSKKVRDELGDLMKMYEKMEAQRRFMPLLPIVARLDGRSFSKFTKGMARPYCPVMQKCMIETTRRLVKETNASMGYTQSDEITLSWFVDNMKSKVWFDGRIQKMLSQLSAQGTLMFYTEALNRMPSYAQRMPTFDARVWQFPNVEVASEAFRWREIDATKNSITMAAATLYSHSELMGKSSKQRIQMMYEKGLRWEDFPDSFKRGTFIQRVVTDRKFTEEEISKLPPRHAARLDPDISFYRSVIEEVAMPPFSRVSNRAEVIFAGAKPVLYSSLVPLEVTDGEDVA